MCNVIKIVLLKSEKGSQSQSKSDQKWPSLVFSIFSNTSRFVTGLKQKGEDPRKHLFRI